MFREVEQFNKEIIGIHRKPGAIEDDTEYNWLIGACLEELNELNEARKNGDFIAQIDAIMDLIYFAAGALVRMGLDASASSEIFQAIHECNMLKAKGKKKSRLNPHDLDAVKPENWVSPEESIVKILEAHYENNS